MTEQAYSSSAGLRELQIKSEEAVKGKASEEDIELSKIVLRKGIEYIEMVLEKIIKKEVVASEEYINTAEYALQMGTIYWGMPTVTAKTVINLKGDKTGLENEELKDLAHGVALYFMNHEEFVHNPRRKKWIKITDKFIQKAKAFLEETEKIES